jgi:hypothetical protein
VIYLVKNQRLWLIGFHDDITNPPVALTRWSALNPIFTWVRLVQRIPVRIHIDSFPMARISPSVKLARSISTIAALTDQNGVNQTG